MTGALRSYLKGRGLDVNHSTLRAIVPVDLRPPERAGQLGNEFGLVILELALAKASLVVTNVVGPRELLYLAGVPSSSSMNSRACCARQGREPAVRPPSVFRPSLGLNPADGPDRQP